VPVIPVAMIGTDQVNPPGSKMWRFGRVQVKFGKPMDFSRFEGLAGNRFIERAVIDEVMYELMRLGGQEYVDLYAADIKEGNDGKDDIAVKPPARMPEAAAG
jgi:1-acyl-sn-glycerol-3-phosphate acyltransferase